MIAWSGDADRGATAPPLCCPATSAATSCFQYSQPRSASVPRTAWIAPGNSGLRRWRGRSLLRCTRRHRDLRGFESQVVNQRLLWTRCRRRLRQQRSRREAAKNKTLAILHGLARLRTSRDMVRKDAMIATGLCDLCGFCVECRSECTVPQWEYHNVLRKAIKARLSLAESFSPNSCPFMGRVFTP
jgi:hypothetical protein